MFAALAIGILQALPAAAPSPIHIVTTPAAGGVWLDRLNSWRGSTAVPALSENPSWSQGDYDHALYMVKTGDVAHQENPASPYYTTAGDTAARNGNIQVSSTTGTSDQQAIDWWMAAPFHAMGMMDPRLGQTGFGSYRDGTTSPWQEGATLDTLRGNSFTGGQYPVYFPGSGTTEPLTAYSGGEFPDPLQACPGYSAPSGLPVFVEVGGNVATTAGPVHSFTGNGVALEHCVIDSTNPSVGSNLVGRGGVIVIPRLPLQSGVRYTVALTVNGTPLTWSFTVGPFVTCPSVTASVAPLPPSAANTPVTFTGSASGCPNPRYRFWIWPPGGAWGIVQDYSPSSTYNWTSTGTPGLYHLEVDVRDQSSGATYDSVANLTYTINGSVTCATAGISPNPTSPSPPGTQVIWTGTSTGCPNPRYRFWELDPGSRWSMVQDYAAAATYTWHSPSIAGIYRFEVDVRDASESTVYDIVNNSSYALGSTPPCANAGLTAAPLSPGATGASVVLSGSSATCISPRYRFWVKDPGRPWSMVQDYSAATTHAWPQTGLAGIYQLEVDVRDVSETTVYDVVANITYVVSGCTAAGLTANPPNTAAHGTMITLTATSTCPGTATYKFWIQPQGGSWTVVQAYGNPNTFAWTPATSGTYYLEVDVKDQGGTDTYEKVSNITYVVT